MKSISAKAMVFVLALSAGTASFAAEWIRPADPRVNASFILSKGFSSRGAVKRATLKGSAAGIGVWKVNGRVVNGFYQPDVSYYERETFFETIDVTNELKAENVLEVEVGGGWFEQNLAWACENGGKGLSYGHPAAWGELEIEYADGSSATIGTDQSWRASDGRVVWNNIYGGEILDARVRGRADKVCLAEDIKTTLRPAALPACRILRELKPVSVRSDLGARTPSWIFDFGTNVAGTVRLKLPPLVAGSRLRVRLAETLTMEGALDPRSTGAFATHHAPEYVFIAPEVPQEMEWTPRFSYTSFRYAEVSGFESYPDSFSNWKKAPPMETVTALMIATPLRATSGFTCENDEINRLLAVAHNTVRCNVHGIPEDCPGREKGGWLGDAQLVAPFVLQNYGAKDLYVEFMRHLRNGTELHGTIPSQVPTHRAFSWEPAPAIWRAAAVTIPYNVWMQTGDEQIVRDNWSLVLKCLDMFVKSEEKGLIRQGYGDWVPPPHGNKSETRMPVHHSSTLCFIECVQMADRMSKDLGLSLPREVVDCAERVKVNFVKECYDAKSHTFGYDGSDAAAWCLGLVADDAAKLVELVVRRVEKRDYMMTTGIFGSPFFAKMMFRTGHGDVLMKTFFNPRQTSYRTVLDDGFTTLPEDFSDRHQYARGEGMPHSYSHPMHASWLRTIIEDACGVRPLEPGYRSVEVRPGDFRALGKVDFTVGPGIRFSGTRDDFKVSAPDEIRIVGENGEFSRKKHVSALELGRK